MSLFQFPQPPLEIAGLGRPDKDLDDPRQLRRLAGCDGAADSRIGDGRHRVAEITGAAQRRHVQPHRPPAARRNDAFEAGLPDYPFRNRPSGLPERPFKNRPRPSRPSCFCKESTSTHFSFTLSAPTPSAALRS